MLLNEAVMDEVTSLLKNILYASKNRLITVTNKEYEEVLQKIEIFLEKGIEKKDDG